MKLQGIGVFSKRMILAFYLTICDFKTKANFGTEKFASRNILIMKCIGVLQLVRYLKKYVPLD